MTGLFLFTAIGSFPVIFSVTASQTYIDVVVPICLFLMNMGTSMTFGNLYMSHMDVFPIVFNSTSMGICNILARSITITAPIVAEVEEPVPEIIFTTLSFIAAVMSVFIRKKTKNFY